MRGGGRSEVARTDGLHGGRGIRWLRLLFQRRRRGCERSVVEFHRIDRAINASAHEGRRRRVVVVTRRAHGIEGMLMVVVVVYEGRMLTYRSVVGLFAQVRQSGGG